MTETTRRPRPWWQVTPRELAWRHGCDPDEIHESTSYPDTLDDWQLDLLLEAVEYAEKTLARLSIPDREDES